MANIQFIQTTPEELAATIAENVKNQLQELKAELHPAGSLQKEILNRDEVAELFGITLVTVHDWMKKGILKPHKIGGRTYFKATDINQLFHERKNA